MNNQITMTPEAAAVRPQRNTLETRHTPEPWVATDRFILSGSSSGSPYIADCIDGEKYRERGSTAANTRRIVDCVNACSGLEFPTLEIANLRELLLFTQRTAIQVAGERAELLAALNALVACNEIALGYADAGRTETRWTAKDGIAAPGELANCTSLRLRVAEARAAIVQAEGGDK